MRVPSLSNLTERGGVRTIDLSVPSLVAWSRGIVNINRVSTRMTAPIIAQKEQVRRACSCLRLCLKDSFEVPIVDIAHVSIGLRSTESA